MKLYSGPDDPEEPDLTEISFGLSFFTLGLRIGAGGRQACFHPLRKSATVYERRAT
jgi:hypothetical protein